MSAAALVALTALDPDVARMLGLSWHDPVDAGRWDYQVVAHHGQVRYPGSSVTFDDLPVGALGSSRLVSDGLTIVGASGLEVVAASGTSGHALALRVPPPLVGTAAGVRFAMPTPSMTLRLDGATVVQFAAWRGARRVGSATSVTGTVTLEDPEGIDTVTWSTGPLDLLEVRRRDGVGLVGDLVAHVWDVSPAAPRAVRGLALTRGNATVEPTRLGVHGTAPAARGVVGLDWEATDPVEDVHRPVRAQVGLLHPDDDGTRRPIVRNAALSTPAFAEPAAHAELGRVANRRGPDLPQRYVERGLGPGSYTWTVRGIDAFGRLGAWSPELAVTVAAGTTPPPPEAVEAAFLDPADPLLSPEHRALVERDGSGLLVSWAWPARRRIAAPGFEPDGEFRVLTRRGDPNLHAGTVLAVSVLGDTSLLDTDLTVAGPASALAGERVRVNGTSFPVVANGTGRRAWLEVAHRVNPTVKPQPGPCTISVSEAGALHVDLTDPRSFDVPVHVEPVGVREQVTATVVAVERGSGTDPVTATVTLDAALPDGAVTATPGRLVAADVAWRVLSQTRGSARLVVQASPQVDGSAAWPSVGQRCTLWAGARYEVWLPGFDARPTASRQVALTLVSVTARDVSAGGLEGPAARAARVEVPHRGAPEAVVVSRPPMHDGDIPADRTAPADWHGRARYLLGFTPALGATGYRVLRVSVAALAEADRAARAAGAPPYQTGPFDDAGDSRAWLTEHHPSIGVTDLTADLSTHPDALSVLAAWREWTAWYYPRRLNRELMALAELECNQAAFCPAHEGTIPGPPFMDSLDGRGLGRYLYRVRPVDASHNVGAWSAAFPVVEVYDVTPPAVPSLVSVSGGEHEVTLRWRANREPDLSGYRIWRARSAAELVDVRRRPVHAVAFPNAPTGTEVWTDAGLAAGVDVAYRIAAVDTTGNVSVPTAVATARPVDTVPPNPTVWRSAEWGRDGRRPAVILAWEVDESGLRCRLERRADIARTWTSLTGWLAAEEPRAHDDAAHAFRHVDATADPGRRWFYRVRVRDASGNLATGMVELFVDAREEAGD